MKRLRNLLVIIVGGAVALALFVVWSAGQRPGARAEGDRLTRMQASPQWAGARFMNQLERVDGPWSAMIWEFFMGGEDHREPEIDLASVVEAPDHLDQPAPPSGRVTWFGHSSLLVELDGVRVLVDPIWTERASPFTWAGPKRFYPPPVALERLTGLDAVVISHDHYDHLDMEAVKRLLHQEIVWLCPLGVGAHLESWGVPPARVVELDWWESHRVGRVELTATPSRHFSGRSPLFLDQNATLWAGWAFLGETQRVFYSGDTAFHPEFEAIGARLGPFDLTVMETGAYDALWSDVHLGPEQAVLAHRMVRGHVMLPVHWGMFDLALHGWTEPIERVLSAARALDVPVVAPRPGGAVVLGEVPSEVSRWWPERPWRPLEDAPAWSTSMRAYQAPLRAPGP